MKIAVPTNALYANHASRTGSPAGSSGGASSFAAILNARTAQATPVASSATKDARQLDFTSMTRQEVFDWMNGQIRAGKMTLDESTAFLGMTLKISAATGQPVDMATDTTRENFIEKARLGIEWARSHYEPDQAKRLQEAVEIMQRRQGEALGV